MPDTPAPSPSAPAEASAALAPHRPWLVAGPGLLLFALCWLPTDADLPLWLPGLGVGLALLSWVGWRVLPLLALALFLAEVFARGWQPALFDAFLYIGQIAASWFVYHRLARGSRWFDDPNSCAAFLLLVPGLVAAVGALVATAVLGPADGFGAAFGWRWLAQALGLVVPVPFLWVLLTPTLRRLRLIHLPLPPELAWPDWTAGDAVEIIGLTLTNVLLTGTLVLLHLDEVPPHWSLWAGTLLLVVWAGMRQGLRGGVLSASVSVGGGLLLAAGVGLTPARLSPTQSNLIAQCGAGLLVGSSAGWVRARESRYRHVVSHVPLVLYSVRLPRPLAPPTGRAVALLGPTISQEAAVTLVSEAARQVFGSAPDELLGPYAGWLGRIVPEDRELLLAALAQLALQTRPVTCEYRVELPAEDGEELRPRWVRDTMTPQYRADGLLDGWEGFVEDVNDYRALAQNLRRTSGMLQALVANLPMGVYFVQGETGFPLLVNARARELLGQREDLSAGVTHLSEVYRLHRPDGSDYPPDELPIVKALRLGTPFMADDVVVHRPDGRRVPLISWAAPVQLGGGGQADAAVWVLEDLARFQQAETMRIESEWFLRAVLETLAVGVLVQDAAGLVLDCNNAALELLGKPREELLGQPWAVDGGPRIERVGGRAVYVQAVALPSGPGIGSNPLRARWITTLTDVTVL